VLVCDDVVIRQDAFTLRASWQVAAGDKVAVIGPSGAGKSTLLNAIAGFVPLSGGRLSWAGQDLGALDPGARPLTILFQDQNLFPHLTLAQNVTLGLSPSLRLDRASRERVEAALERVGLGGLGARRPTPGPDGAGPGAVAAAAASVAGRAVRGAWPRPEGRDAVPRRRDLGRDQGDAADGDA
jgi:thiamine transport system ATP-binding protein